MSENILQANEIFKSFKRNTFFKPSAKNVSKEVLCGANLSVSRSDFICLVGENGSGKTTLLKIISGLISQDSGQITHDLNITMVTDNDRSMFWRLTVQQNLDFFSNISCSKCSDLMRDEILQILDLKPLLDQEFMKLSSGQKKKALICRSLFANPDLIVLDEITNSLDHDTKLKLINFFYDKVFRKYRVPIIWSTHNPDEINNYATRIIKLNNGRLEEVVDERD